MLSPLLLLVACSGDDSSKGSDDPQAPFGPVTRTSITRVKQTNSDGSVAVLAGQVEGDVTTPSGDTLTKFVLTDTVDATAPAKEILAGPLPVDPSGTIKLGLFDDHESVRLEADPPAEFDLGAGVGNVQTVAGSVTATFPNTSVEVSGTGSVALSIKSTNEAVPTPTGLVPNCVHIGGQGTLTAADIPAEWASTNFTGDIWIHPERGFVAVDLPELGLSFDSEGLTDYGEPKDGWGNIRAVGVVEPANPSFSLSTYDVNQDFDADMRTHATMILELRWVDETNAKSELEPGYPMANIEFGTTMGYFSSTMTKSDVSFFYPEEKGQGYVYWIGVVSQAAKNQAEPNDSYHVSVISDYDSPLRATARIVYKLYSPEG